MKDVSEYEWAKAICAARPELRAFACFEVYFGLIKISRASGQRMIFGGFNPEIEAVIFRALEPHPGATRHLHRPNEIGTIGIEYHICIPDRLGVSGGILAYMKSALSACIEECKEEPRKVRPLAGDDYTNRFIHLFRGCRVT